MRAISEPWKECSRSRAPRKRSRSCFNEVQAGPLHTRRIALTVRDENRHVIAGLTGEIFWNALYVDLLWVDEPYRGNGYGKALLHRAEALAVEASCACVYLSTFEFQAPEFYSWHDYSVIGELSDVPRGFRRQWFCKKFHQDIR